MTTIATVDEFNARAKHEWGDVRRTHSQLFDCNMPLISDLVEFPMTSRDLKVHLAETILRESTPRCGAISECGDARWFIHNFGHDMCVIDPPFDVRRVSVMKAALMLLAHVHFNLFSSEERAEIGDLKLIFGMGGSGLASLYILSQLEYLFRVNSTYLDADGKINKDIPPALATAIGLKGKRLASVSTKFNWSSYCTCTLNQIPCRSRFHILTRTFQSPRGCRTYDLPPCTDI